MPSFVKVAKKSELPTETGKLVEANGREIVLYLVEGKVYATHNLCPHQGGPLSEGGLRGNQVMCPWHGWNFNVTNGKCAFNEKITVPTFQVKEEGDDIWVSA